MSNPNPDRRGGFFQLTMTWGWTGPAMGRNDDLGLREAKTPGIAAILPIGSLRADES